MTRRPSTNPRTTAAGLLLAACAAAPFALTGCAGHGKYTSDHISGAQQKMALMKSGTEWKMAQQQFLSGDLDKALRSVDNSIALNPEVPKAHVLRGRILIEKGQLEAARMSLLEAERIDPTFVESHYYQGILQERFSMHEEALACYLTALELDPASAQCLVAAAEMMVQLGRLGEAEAFLDERRSTFKYNAAVRQTLGHIALMQGKHAQAVEFFDEARLLAPDDPAILEDLVRAQVASDNFAQAEFNIGRLLDLPASKNRRDLLRLRARCLVQLDRPVEARSVLIHLTSDKEGASDFHAWVELGNVSAIINDQARLKTAAARAIAIAPERYEGYFLRAVSLHRQGDLAGALDAASRAAALSRSDAGPLVLQGLLLFDSGKADAARASLSSALELDPAQAPARQLLAAIDASRGHIATVDPASIP